jgi:hypothetical protein
MFVVRYRLNDVAFWTDQKSSISSRGYYYPRHFALAQFGCLEFHDTFNNLNTAKHFYNASRNSRQLN